jgi:hypothetical protein
MNHQNTSISQKKLLILEYNSSDTKNIFKTLIHLPYQTTTLIMKRNLNLLSYVLIASVLVFSACKKTTISPEQEQIDALSATWNLTEATPQGFDAIALTGVSITFTGEKTYTVNGVATLVENNLNIDDSFAESGSFTLSGDTFNLLSLSSGGSFTIVSLNRESGAISLSYSTKYPKSTSSDVSVTINGTLAN